VEWGGCVCGVGNPMYNVKLFGILTMNSPVQWIYPNKNKNIGKKITENSLFAFENCQSKKCKLSK
jgi:hypothetical protein